LDTLRTDRGNGGVVLTAFTTRTDDNRVGTPRPTGKKKEKLKLVEVSWIDAYAESSWAEYSPETTATKTYGLFVGKTKEWTTLAMSRDKTFWGNLWYIPTKNVVTMREIETIDPD